MRGLFEEYDHKASTVRPSINQPRSEMLFSFMFSVREVTTILHALQFYLKTLPLALSATGKHKVILNRPKHDNEWHFIHFLKDVFFF